MKIKPRHHIPLYSNQPPQLMLIMPKNIEGQTIPQTTFHTLKDNSRLDVSSDDLFAGKKVILFALPGAFTPTCSSSHLPRYNELAPVFAANGIDSIVCLSVNDAHVMDAWQAGQNAGNIRFIPDGNGEFSKAMGMLVDLSVVGFGPRSWRYSMVVDDGVIEKMFIEPAEPAGAFEVSDADTMLNYVAPEAKKPIRITIFTKPGCPHCVKAKLLLSERGLDYEEIELGKHGISYSSLVAVSGAGTSPQIYIDGEHIGGAEDLEAWLA